MSELGATPRGLGTLLVVDFFGCDVPKMHDMAFVKHVMLKAAAIAKATVVADVFHAFNPQGISGVVVIAESHLAIHTWPEHACMTVDIFTCNDGMDADGAITYLKESFDAAHINVTRLYRGRFKS